MSQHYFHKQYQHLAKWQNINPLKIIPDHSREQTILFCQNRRKNFVCLSNGNAVQVFRVNKESIDFYCRKQFFCNIRKLQVVPSLHHDADFVFILDELGRWTFWNPATNQQIQTSNIVLKQSTNKRFYREEMAPQEEQEFSGGTIVFNVKDTQGYIFFTVQSKLVVLTVSIKQKQSLKITDKRVFEIPYTRFRYVNCLKMPKIENSQLFLGIIQEIEQKTILKMHKLRLRDPTCMIDEDSLEWKIDKINLLSFQSGEKDEVLLLTYDQITLFKPKQNIYLCNYRTRGNYGATCYIEPFKKPGSLLLGEATYIHLGYEMTVFTKHRLANYGPLKYEGKNILENCSILQSKFLGTIQDEAGPKIMIAFVTSWNQVYFCLLGQNNWKLIRRMKSLGSIFSVQDIPNNQQNQSIIVVHSANQSESQVSLVYSCIPTIISEEQTLDFIVESIEILENGESIVICGQEENYILSWDQTQKMFISHFQFPKQQVLACADNFIALTTGIYQFDIIEQAESDNSLKLTPIAKEENILSAVYNDKYIGYYTSEGSFKYFELESTSVARVRKNCQQEYIWHMLPNSDILISAAYSQLGQLRLLPIHKASTKINLKVKQLISSLETIQVFKVTNKMIDERQSPIKRNLIIGYHSGEIQVYSLDEGNTLRIFKISNQSVQLCSYRQGSVLVYTASKQFILTGSIINYELHRIELNNGQNTLKTIKYLPLQDLFLIYLQNHTKLKQTTLQLRKFEHINKNIKLQTLPYELKTQALQITTLLRASNEMPMVEIDRLGEFFYVAVGQCLMKYSLANKTLVKKQLHLLKSINGITKVRSGILLTGVDVMDNGSVVLFDFEDLEILQTHNLGKNIPTAIRGLTNPQNHLQTDRFLIRQQQYVSLFQIQQTKHFNLIKITNTKTMGSSLQLNEKYNKLLINDPYRYVIVYEYETIPNHEMMPISKYYGSFMINECVFLDGVVVLGDRGGKLTFLEFNLDSEDDVRKMEMTNVGEIYVGDEIFAMRSSSLMSRKSENISSAQTKKLKGKDTGQLKKSVCYGTSSGILGRLNLITNQEFQLLKKIQEDILNYHNGTRKLFYELWRGRKVSQDKIIDGQLIKQYLQTFVSFKNHQDEQFYDLVKKLYHKCEIFK